MLENYNYWLTHYVYGPASEKRLKNTNNLPGLTHLLSTEPHTRFIKQSRATKWDPSSTLIREQLSYTVTFRNQALALSTCLHMELTTQLQSVVWLPSIHLWDFLSTDGMVSKFKGPLTTYSVHKEMQGLVLTQLK
jgi:hypothetical protein